MSFKRVALPPEAEEVHSDAGAEAAGGVQHILGDVQQK
jgi:hypothetical protein